MFSKNFLLLLIAIFSVSLSVAQIDIDDDDSEAEVEDHRPEGAVVGGPFLDDEPDDGALKPSPDADTVFLFTQPPGAVSELPAGKDVHFLVGLANKGHRDLIVESLDASFRYPLDFTFHIQNFSAVSYDRVVKPRQDVSLHYAFYTSETYSARPFGLVVNLHYRDADGKRFQDAVFNETVTIVEAGDSLDGEAFFLYILLAAVAVLLVVATQQCVVNFTRRKVVGVGHKVETGTQQQQRDVDYDWLPRGALGEFNRSPKQSVKQSPKQGTRRVKRGAKDE